MRLVLVRHGEAEPMRHPDGERALTDRGRRQAAETAEWLRGRLGDEFVLVCSSYRRARETAGVIQQKCSPVALQVVEGITPEDDLRKAVGIIESLAQRHKVLVIVSHMPLVAGLASWIGHGVYTGGRPFALAEARLFDMEIPGAGQGSLTGDYIPAG